MDAGSNAGIRSSKGRLLQNDIRGKNAGKVRKTFLRGGKVAGKGMYAGNNAYERARKTDRITK